MILNPITLPASKMLATMTTLIGQIRYENNLNPSDIVNDLVNSCRVGKVEYGKGIVNTFKVALQPVHDLSENSTVTKITKPNVAQETIMIDKYKTIPLSISEILGDDSVVNGESINTFLSYIMDLLEDTNIFYLYDECNKLYQEWTPGQTTQTIEVEQLDTTNLTGVDLNNALQWNSNQMAKVMRKTLNNMKIKNNKYTDISTYTDVNTGEEGKVTSALRGDNLKLVVNDKYWTEFLANSLASLYHSEKVGEMIPGDSFVLIPEDSMSQSNTNTIGWLSAKNKFALADFYKLTLNFSDASTLYINYFEHFAYGAGVFKYAPGVKFVAKIITPSEAGTV